MTPLQQTLSHVSTRRVLIALLLLLGPLPGLRAAEPGLLAVVRKARNKDVSYRAPRPAELRKAERLFADTISRRAEFEPLRQRWAKLHFQLVSLYVGQPGEIWIVRESNHRRTGRGIYAIRPGASIPLVLQAPHAFFDRHTREICAQLARRPEVAAAAWNTTHRSIVDVAHVRNHYFQAFTRAVSANLRGSVVVQLHGFDEQQRDTHAGMTASMIVSNGSNSLSRFTLDFAHRLQQAFPGRAVRLFPWTVQEMGATSNEQAAVVRAQASSRFLSIEINRPSRDRFRVDAHWRDEFFKVLLASVRIRATHGELTDSSGSSYRVDQAN